MKNLKSKRFWILFIAFTSFSMLINACGPAQPTVDIDAQRTGFAQTADAQAAATAEAMPTATPTDIPTATPTITPEATATPANSEEEPETEGDTPAETEQPAPPTGGGIDTGVWRENDPPDKTNFAPGESFTVTCMVENVGTSTWTTQYYIQFATGDPMGVEQDAKINMPYPVPPNTSFQINVDFVAPQETGEKVSWWKLVNAEGNEFYRFNFTIDVVAPGETEEPSPTPAETTTP